MNADPNGMIGKTYGFWRVESMAESRRCNATCLKCNTVHNVATFNLRNGRSEMCRKCFLTQGHGHNFRNSHTYRVWNGMKQRCYNANNDSYPNYGARGIRVCKEWWIFDNFLKDMGIGPDELTIDRIDNNGNYEPKNCKWATDHEQRRNKRNCHFVILNGERMIARDAARAMSMAYTTLLAWLKRNPDFNGDLNILRFEKTSTRWGRTLLP